jgi:DNA-binding FrmR family transcriptional regulator
MSNSEAHVETGNGSSLGAEARMRLRRIEGQVRALQSMLDELEGATGLEAKARELVAGGMSQAEAARTLGLSRRRVADAVNDRCAPECEPCDGMLTQVLAVRAAVEQVGRLVMELHLQRCVFDGVPMDEERQAALRESLKLWSRLNSAR